MKDESILASVVYDHIRDMAGIHLEYEYLPADKGKLPCGSVQTLTGTPVSKRYKDGSYIGNYRFAVYLRCAADDSTSRLDAASELTSLAKQIEESIIELPAPFTLWNIEQDTLPVKVDAEVAYEDWQATFTLTYKKGS